MQHPDLYYLHGDHLGTATFVTNSQGDATQFFLNLPFGETMLEQMDGSYNNPYKFNAKELDEDTGLYYYGARYYNPRLSIWYGVDPLAIFNPVMETEFYGNGQHNGGVFFWGNLNPYIYTYQNPINYIDPDGKQVKLSNYGGGTVNLYVQQLDPTTKRPGKYEYIRIQGDASKPTVNVYQHRDNPTRWGYGTLEERTSGELQQKQVEISFKSGSLGYQDDDKANKNLDFVSKSIVSIDQSLEVYGSSSQTDPNTIVADIDNGNKDITVENLANNRSDKIKGQLIERGVNSSSLKRGQNQYGQKNRATILKFNVQAKQVISADQIINKTPKTGYDAGKKN
ncbi:hypothetical protein ASE55_19680 [Chryseobacterium sp. Leaf201]|nr:hypothetical protein ASE55_19680 [Chryseobacterium sp. Leaf201]